MFKMFVAICLVTAVLHRSALADDTYEDLLKKAASEAQDRNLEDAIKLLDRAIELDAKLPAAWRMRGLVHAGMGEHEKAVKDLTESMSREKKPDAALIDVRGGEYFKSGRIKESIADFDQAIAQDPAREPGHWQRGISYYYAEEFEKGKKQFEGYQSVDNKDVENAVWRFLCMARSSGVEAARKDILKIGKDARVPMMEIYNLFAGTGTEQQVMDAVAAGSPTAVQTNERLFYAHLYLALYYEATGQSAKVEETLKTALEHKIGHYMWDVCRVHLQLLKESKRDAATKEK